MISCFIRADRLRLAALFQSKEPERYYLNGVFIEPCEIGDEGGVRIAATDGTLAALFRDRHGHVARPMIINVPKSGLAAIRAVRKHEEFVWFGLIGPGDRPGRHEARIFDSQDMGLNSLDEIQEAMRNPCHDGVIWSGAVRLIDGDYPAVERVVPITRMNHAEGATFSAVKMSAFQEVARTIGVGEAIRIWPAGPGNAMLVDCGRGDFVGVLMPCNFAKAESFGAAAHPDAHTADWAWTVLRAGARSFHEETSGEAAADQPAQ